MRPTTDYAKSGLFNILANRVDFESITVLDLFCGAGGITFEFASRGAIQVVSVDQYPGCTRFVQDTAVKLQLNQIRTVKADVFKFLKSPSSQAFDIVFADPPFDMENRDMLPALVLEHQWVKPGGWLILERPSGEDPSGSIAPEENRKYGNCSFSFYRYRPETHTTSV